MGDMGKGAGSDMSEVTKICSSLLFPETEN